MNQKEALYQRLEILENSGLITSQVSEQTDRILKLLFSRNQEIDQEKLEVFTTHIGMALQRVLDGQYEAPLDRDILEGLKEEEIYEEAEKFAGEIRKMVEIEIPDSEAEYLIVHLCNLFS